MTDEVSPVAATVSVAVHLRSTTHRWRISFASLPFDASPGSPWLLITPEARRAFDLLIDSGPALARTSFGPPLLGVKSGCNEAFIISVDDPKLVSPGTDVVGDTDTVIVSVAERRAPERNGLIERALLRPVVRGESLRAWRVICSTGSRGPGCSRDSGDPGQRVASQWIIWTHAEGGDDGDLPLAALPVHTEAWLSAWKHRLATRSDLQRRTPWWALFRTASARSTSARVVWSDLGRRPRAAVLPAGDRRVPLNSCYVIPCDDPNDAYALAALLNSEIVAAWLNVVAEPAANGYRRYLAWTVGLLPLPEDWSRARDLLAPIGRAATGGAPPDDSTLTMAVARAYGVSPGALRPLLEWTNW